MESFRSSSISPKCTSHLGISLGSRFCEQQQGPLKGPGTLLTSLAGTAVHRVWPAGQIVCLGCGGYTTAPYVFSTNHVGIGLGAALRALEVCLCLPVAGVDVIILCDMNEGV